MPKINQEEYELLKSLDDKWEWIARDEDGDLDVFEEEPYRGSYMKNPNRDVEVWLPIIHTDYKHINSGLFQFIQWEDEEPYSIQELIEEYEYSTEHVSHVVNERVKALGKAWRESEEKEVSKQEVIQALNNLKNTIEISDSRNNSFKYTDGIKSVVDKILPMVEKLPEQETLSPEWIEKNREPMYFNDTMGYYVHHKRLEGLLVPKQEEVDQAYKAGYETGKDHATRSEKPVIPQYVADYIKKTKPMKSLRVAFALIEDMKEKDHENKLAFWLSEGNSETFASAWLDGYEVEEEPKYVIKLDDESYLQRYEIDNKNVVTPFRIVGHFKEVAIKFDNKEKANKVAELVEGEVEELKE